MTTPALGAGSWCSTSSQSPLCGDISKEPGTQPCDDGQCPGMRQVQAGRQAAPHLNLQVSIEGRVRVRACVCACVDPQGRGPFFWGSNPEQVRCRGCWERKSGETGA